VIEKITKNDCVFATIIRSDFKTEGIVFFTPHESTQQMAYMNRPKGHLIDAHKHGYEERFITQSSEVLIVKTGKVKVFIYDEHDEFYAETIIQKGDVILLSGCGHGFEMLEDSEMVEIKQGPYSGNQNCLPINTYSAKNAS
jgi:hypothetical protein